MINHFVGMAIPIITLTDFENSSKGKPIPKRKIVVITCRINAGETWASWALHVIEYLCNLFRDLSSIFWEKVKMLNTQDKM